MKHFNFIKTLFFAALFATTFFMLFTSSITEKGSDHKIIVQMASDLADTKAKLETIKSECNEMTVSSDPFIGEIVMFGGNFAPRGWALCNGQLLPINQYQALFSILGTTYGGDGRTTFGLPDLRGRVPMHSGQGPGLEQRRLGQKFGKESTNIKSQVLEISVAQSNSGRGTKVVTAIDDNPSIMQPIQCVNFIIALNGTYPSRS